MTATLIVAGDLCATGRIGEVLSGPNAAPLWGDLGALIHTADFSVVNVECPLTDHSELIVKSGPRLWGSAGAARGIRAGGFTAACLANNHVLDAGPAGLRQTIRNCQEAGLPTVGAGENVAAATVPLLAQAGDMRLSLLAFAENEFSTASGPNPGAWPFDLIDNPAQIAGARSVSDYVLVLLHGGAEHYPLPSPRMQKACRFFVEMGADAVICHHSHIAGGNEWYKGRPIVYGTGNLLFDSFADAEDSWFTGQLVKLEVAPHETLRMQLEPYRQYPTEPRVQLMVDPERASFLAGIAELDAVVFNDTRLKESWTTFCLERKSFYLGSLLCLTRPESWLLDRGLLPSARVRLTKQRLARLRNLFSCESHSESCERVLRELLKEGDRTAGLVDRL